MTTYRNTLAKAHLTMARQRRRATRYVRRRSAPPKSRKAPAPAPPPTPAQVDEHGGQP